MAASIISAYRASLNALTLPEFTLLGDALATLTEHFMTADAMPEGKAWPLACKALQVDPAQWKLVGASHRRQQRAAAASLASFTRSAEALAEAYAGRAAS